MFFPFFWLFPPPTPPHLAVAAGPWRRRGRGDLHQETRQIRGFEGQLQAEQLEQRAADGPEVARHGVPGRAGGDLHQDFMVILMGFKW